VAQTLKKISVQRVL